MTIAVFLEHHEGELQKGSLGVLGKAASLGGNHSGYQWLIATPQ